MSSDSLLLDIGGVLSLAPQLDAMERQIEQIIENIGSVLSNLDMDLDGSGEISERLRQCRKEAVKQKEQLEKYRKGLLDCMDDYRNTMQKGAETMEKLSWGVKAASVMGQKGIGQKGAEGASESAGPSVSWGISAGMTGISSMAAVLGLGAAGVGSLGIGGIGNGGKISGVSRSAADFSYLFGWNIRDAAPAPAISGTQAAKETFDKNVEMVEQALSGTVNSGKKIAKEAYNTVTDPHLWGFVGNTGGSLLKMGKHAFSFMTNVVTLQWADAAMDAGDVINDVFNTGQDASAVFAYEFGRMIGQEEKGLKYANEMAARNGLSGELRASGHEDAAQRLDDISRVLSIPKNAYKAGRSITSLWDMGKNIDEKTFSDVFDYVTGYKTSGGTTDLERLNNLLSNLDALSQTSENAASGEGFQGVTESFFGNGAYSKFTKSWDQVNEDLRWAKEHSLR